MAQAKHARAKQTRAAKTPSPRRTGAAGADASKAVRGGIAQLVTPSPELGAIVGMAPLSRAEVTTRVWSYIKAHELQDAQDRRQIHADATLHKVLGRDQVSMFEMTKLLNQVVYLLRADKSTGPALSPLRVVELSVMSPSIGVSGLHEALLPYLRVHCTCPTA